VDWFNEMYLRVFANLRSLRDREEGQAMIEYSVLIAIITAGVIVTIGVIGGYVGDAFTAVQNAMAP
jgi:pilus assembly protein Flp/PilA